MAVSLVVFKPKGSSVELDLKPGDYVIGRSPEARLRIPLPNVSRKHCELSVAQGAVTVRDLGSSNGTFRSGERLEQSALTELFPGDVLTIGTCQAVVRINGEPAEIEAPEPVKPRESASGSSSASADHLSGSQTMPVHSDHPKQQSAAATAEQPAEDGAEGEDGEATHDLDTTVQNDSPQIDSLLGDADDSSLFDFDFDFEEDENPKL